MRINQLRESNYIDPDEAEEYSRGLIQATPNNLKRFEQFLKVKWAERSKQRYDSWGDTQDKPWQPPATLEGACKFTSLFANRLFGGRMRGNQKHQYLELPNGKIIDPVPVPGVANPQQHDEEFWMNPDHKDSLESCLPRVNEWVKEFMSMNESQITEMSERNRLPNGASWYKGAFPWAALQDDNRRFMFNPMTSTFVIGEHDVLGKGDGVPSSHDEEFKASGAPGTRHEYMISGWVGIGGSYKNGVIHFAPPIFDMDMEDESVRQAATRAIEGFRRSGANKNTVLRNFGTRGERKLGTVTEAVITELTKGVKKGSQKREKIGFATDDPAKYVGKWEEYTEPQGINSKAAKKSTKVSESALDGIKMYHGQPRPSGDPISKFTLRSEHDGLYFTSDPDYAAGYTKEFRSEQPTSEFDSFDETGVLYPVYLNIKNPLVLDGEDHENFEKYTQRGHDRKDLIAQGYDGIIMKYDDGEIEAQAFHPKQVVSAVSGKTFEASIGPVMTRGMANSSTGLGAAPPQIEIEQTPYQKRVNGKQKMAGHKAPMVIVKRNVSKSTKNKNRKLNSPVTEVFNDSSNSYPYHEEGGWTTVDTQIEGLEIVVGMEDIQNYNPDLPPGVNVGMVSQTEDGIHMGVEPAKVGMSTRDTIRLFNTLMNIVREYAATENPERMYFVAVKPMEGIYQRLIRRFVDTNEWNIKIIKDVPIPLLGTKLTTYMIERKNKVTEMVRYPKHKEFNADYEVDECGEIVAKATIHAGVIDEFMVKDDVGGNDFRGKYMSGLMSAIVRDADLTNSNMSMQVYDPDDLEMKRFLERFGFRHFGDGVYKRTAGAITPPSVVY